MPESVFITGIAGFLGSHLADEFIERGYDVSGNDTFVGGYELTSRRRRRSSKSIVTTLMR
ncbi:NAD-dependent epimerase/dehydratase family protein [Halomicroarcula sp. GCM10025710]